MGEPGAGGPCIARVFGPLIVLIVVTLAVQVFSQEPPPQFRSGVQVVEVDVRVFDERGAFVRNLAREDFEVLENGVPQPIRAVFLVEGPAPSPAAETAPAPPGPRAPAAPAASARQTWIFVFDLNHLTPGAGFDRARKAVEQFISDRFQDGDLAGVVAGNTIVNNRLTTVREELVAAARSVKPQPERRRIVMEMTREWPRLLDDREVVQIAREDREAIRRAVIRACTDDSEQCDRADVEVRSKARRLAVEIERNTIQTLQAVNALASGLARVPGPKTIVFLSDGFTVEQVETTLRTVVGQAARAGARIYAIDVRGLNRRGGTGPEQLAATDEAGGFTGFDPLEDAPNSLAVDTGGLMIRNENNIGRALDTIAADSGRYYVLAYQPANTTFDGQYREIEVRVKRPGVRVRARRGYLALEPSRMLLPQPITPPASSPATAAPSGGAAQGKEPRAAPAAAEGAPAAATTASGTIAGAAAAPAEAVRLRPDANSRIETLSAGNTTDAGALARKGWEAYQRGDVEGAIGPLTEAASRPDVKPWVLYVLGFSQVALGRPVDAAASWERVRQAAPEFLPVYIDLADTYVQLSDTTKALTVLREAEARWPDDDEVLNAIGVIHVRRGALDEAIDAFKKTVASAPNEALGYLNLGRAYERRYARGRRWVASQRRWVAPEDDRRRAAEAFERCVKLGGPYAAQAAEALSRLQWNR